MSIARRRVALCALALADAAALVTLLPSPRLAADLAAPRHWLEATGADHAVIELAGAALWLVALWLALGLAAWAARGLPGTPGRRAARLAQVLLPRAVYRLAAGAAGFGVLLAPVASAAAAPAAAGTAAAVQTGGAAGRGVPVPTWPTDQPASAPRWPLTGPAVRARPAHPAPDRDGAPTPVTVRPGDSLWTIAADRLGNRPTAARVAAAWPRWYAANRAEIGSDPALIRPGQTLRPPTASQEDST